MPISSSRMGSNSSPKAGLPRGVKQFMPKIVTSGMKQIKKAQTSRKYRKS